jgi:hypothetical protein
MPREISLERLEKDAKRVLNNPLMLSGLEINTGYIRIHDDTDGTGKGRICVTLAQDGDVWFESEPNHDHGPLRFRTSFGGGGQSPRVRNALLVLALAIKLDNEEHPQAKPGESHA